MSKVLSIASGKGGVGKALLTASLGIVMAYKGYRVLLTDGDMGLRNMDLILGLENECFYNILDLAEGRCFMNDVKLSVSKNLDFIPQHRQKHGMKYSLQLSVSYLMMPAMIMISSYWTALQE